MKTYKGALRGGAVPLAAVVLLVGAGCSQPDPKKMLEGDWKVRPTAAIGQGVRMTDENTTRGQAREIGRFLGSFAVSFRPDGTFTFNMGPTPLEGKWTLDGKKVTMNVTSMGGKAAPPGQGAGIMTFSGEIDTKLGILDVEFPNVGGGAQQLQRLTFEKPEG